MVKRPPIVEEPASEGCPEWMMTFSDCMTLLLTFFVLLMTFSSQSDQGRHRQDQASFMDGSISLTDDAVKRDSILPPRDVAQPIVVERGSEVPVQAVQQLLASSRANPKDNEPRSNKIFLISSEDLFHGRSNVLRSQGKTNLRLLAEYIKLVRARVVISENGLGGDSDLYGLPRALAIMNFFERECGLQSQRMCISVSGTAGQAHSAGQRKVEIALLERSVYQ
ncbi:MAG TPA: flagellar motor protein MotB [Sedimentisphaerales bacterium]|nr:flagellar motor protein MotB [Sedimentisphaerales bacterium]